jgi:hypothetical protein
MGSRLKTLSLALVTLALLLVPAGSAIAATYTVTRTDDPIPGPCEPADCSLREALMAANGTTAVDDVVVVPASAAPYLIQYEFIPFTIADETEVRGAGATQTVVKGDGQETVFAIGGVKTILVGLTITNGKGAIENNGALTIRGVSIEHNEHELTAGGITSGGPVTIESSFLGYNRTKTATGGALHSNGPVTIVNSTIAHNSSETGPAALGVNALLTIRNSALVSNRSEAAGSAGAAAIELTLRDSIFADNRNATGLRNCSSGTPTSLGGNVSDDDTCGTGPSDRPNVDARLGTLALHGGTTPLYALLPGSPAIDFATACPPLDQRGATRAPGAACDSGPYESPLGPPPPAMGDKEFFMRVGKKLRLRKNAIWVRLACPASEVSPPCRGRISIGNPPLIHRGSGLTTLEGQFLKANFTIWPGRTKVVPVRRPFAKAKRLPQRAGTWKVGLIVKAEDAAGNDWFVKRKRAPLIGAKPKRG